MSVGQCIAFNTAISMKPVPHRSRTRATGTTRSVRGRVKIVELGRGSALFAGGTTRNSTRQLRIPACVPSIYLTHVAQLSVPWPGYDFGSVEGSFVCENPKNRRNCPSIAVAPRIYATGRDRGPRGIVLFLAKNTGKISSGVENKVRRTVRHGVRCRGSAL